YPFVTSDHERPPSAAEERDSGERTMGMVSMTSAPVNRPPIEKNYRSRSYTPRAGRKRDSGKRTMGVERLRSRAKRFSVSESQSPCVSESQPPRGGRGTGLRWKNDGGADLASRQSKSRKNGCKSYTPRPRDGSFHLGKGRRGFHISTSRISTFSGENLAAG